MNGFEVALSCGIILSHANAQFGFPKVGLGIIPSFGGTQNLSCFVAKTLAKGYGTAGESSQSKGELIAAAETLLLRFKKMTRWLLELQSGQKKL